MKRYRTTKWHGHDNYECNLCGFKVLRDRGRMVAHVRAEHPTDAEGGPVAGPLAGVDFASDEAAEAAAHLGAAGIERLKRSTPTGKHGGYTVADVKAAHSEEV